MSHEWLQQPAVKKLERRSCPASCKNNDSPTGHKTTFFIPISFNAKCSNDISRLNLWCRQVSVDISWESPCLGPGTDGCEWSWAALKASCSMRASAEYNLDHCWEQNEVGENFTFKCPFSPNRNKQKQSIYRASCSPEANDHISASLAFRESFCEPG